MFLLEQKRIKVTVKIQEIAGPGLIYLELAEHIVHVNNTLTFV